MMALVIVMMIKGVLTTMIMTIRGMMLVLVVLSILEMTFEITPKAKISVKLVTVIETPAC